MGFAPPNESSSAEFDGSVQLVCWLVLFLSRHALVHILLQLSLTCLSRDQEVLSLVHLTSLANNRKKYGTEQWYHLCSVGG